MKEEDSRYWISVALIIAFAVYGNMSGNLIPLITCGFFTILYYASKKR